MIVVLGGIEACRTSRAWRVLETSVRPQEGGPSGGWITDDVVGPCKGPPARGAGSRRDW